MASDKDYAATQARTGLGIRVYFAEEADLDASDWTWVQGLKSGALPSPDKPEIDVSNTDSTVREFIPGLGTIPDMSLELDFYPENEVHQRLTSEMQYGNDIHAWKIEGPSFTFVFLGYLKSINPTFSIDSAMTMPVTLKVTGKPRMTYGNAKAQITWDSTLAGAVSGGAVSGSVVGNFEALNASGAAFTSEVGNEAVFVKGKHYQIYGVPEGLVPVLTHTSANVVTLTFTGTASVKTDVSNIVLKMMDTAFQNTTASAVRGSSKGGIAITFA